MQMPPLLAAALALAAGCTDPAPDAPAPDAAIAEDLPPFPEDRGDCLEGAAFFDIAPRLARGARLDVDIRSSYAAAPGVVSSTRPDILRVAASYEGAELTGLAAGTAELVVSRCGAAVARYAVEVADVAVVELALDDLAPRTEVAALPGPGHDVLRVRYRDADGGELAGTGAATLAFSGGLRGTPGWTRPPLRELLLLDLDGAGAITATLPGAPAPAAALAVAIVPPSAVASLALEVTTLPLFGDDDPRPALRGTAATTDGTPIIGFTPDLAFTPIDAATLLPLPWLPRTIFVLDPRSTLEVTATLGAATATATVEL